MIQRYATPEMSRMWSDQNKYKTWLDVELAVLWAKSELGLIPKEVVRNIKKQARYSCKRIHAIESEIHHDLLAFVESVQERLDPALRRYFHADMTSYDTEEPALARMMRSALELVCAELKKLSHSAMAKAVEFKHMLQIGRTHGQHAEPVTLGLTFLWWYDSLIRQNACITAARDELRFTKISGAVGTYAGGLSPELEKRALEILGLEQAKISGQIILRDRHAHAMNALAVLASVLENIALNIRLLSQTEIGELEEPFAEKQKGSSRMPHKKNTILTERICGLARIVRHNAGIATENIATWDRRDISHSAPERIIIPDSFHVVHYMLKIMNRVIEGLVIRKDRIKKNLEITKGIIFSPDVKELLMKEGMDPEKAYRLSQEIALDSWKRGVPYLFLLRHHPEVRALAKAGSLQELFDAEKKLKHIDAIFQRFGL